MLRKIQDFVDRCLQALSAIGAAIVSPIERLVGGATDKVLTAADQVERVESVLFKLLRLLTWPFRLIAGIFKLLLPEVVTSALSNGWHGLQSLLGNIGQGLLHVAGILSLDRPVLWLVWLTQPIWRSVVAIAIFFDSWINTREYRRVTKALPAIILATLVLGVGTWHNLFGKSQIKSTYREANREALEARNYALSELYEQKLANLGEDTQKSQFNTALALQEEGDLDAAYQRMKLLAPEDHPGYPNAHYWIIQLLLGGQLEAERETAKRLVDVHLGHLETLQVEAPLVQLMKAIALAGDNQLEEAARVLQSVTKVLPSAAYERMRINVQLRRRDQAKQDARDLVNHMKVRSRRGQQLEPADFQRWVTAEDVLGNLPQMRAILERWLAIDQQNESARRSLSKVYRQIAGNLFRAPLPDENQIVELWLKAADLDSSPASLLRLSRALYAEREKSSVYTKILTALHESPKTPASLLLAIGTDAARRGEFVEARPFFAAAASRDENNPVVWNNYGLVLGEEPQPDFEKALEAVNKALAIVPGEHQFRETRGQVLIKMQRWPEAIEDLEYALNGLPNLKQIHKSLAIAYEATGEGELARLHRQRAD